MVKFNNKIPNTGKNEAYFGLSDIYIYLCCCIFGKTKRINCWYSI